jgi:hypothetical protein
MTGIVSATGTKAVNLVGKGLTKKFISDRNESNSRQGVSNEKDSRFI